MSDLVHSPKSFPRLWVTAQPVVSAFVLSAVRNAADAEDLVQSVAESALADFETFDSSRSFTSWALGIARYRILNHYRSKSRDRHVFGDEALAILAEAHELVSHEEEEHMAALRECTSGLPADQQRLLSLRYREDQSPSAIAAQSGASSRSVVNALHHIRRKLAECMRRRLDAGVSRG